jgi:hypothetical protein
MAESKEKNGHENGYTPYTNHLAPINGTADAAPPKGCPFFESSAKKFPEWQTSKSVAIEPISYKDYLQLDKILNAQHPLSAKYDTLVHDEHLFIIIHQGKENG